MHETKFKISMPNILHLILCFAWTIYSACKNEVSPGTSSSSLQLYLLILIDRMLLMLCHVMNMLLSWRRWKIHSNLLLRTRLRLKQTKCQLRIKKNQKIKMQTKSKVMRIVLFRNRVGKRAQTILFDKQFE